MRRSPSLAALAGALVLALLGTMRPAVAAIIFGGDSVVVNSPLTLGPSPVSFIATGVSGTGSLLFTSAMSLPNALTVGRDAIANLQTFGGDVSLTGIVSGAGALSKQFAHSLSLSGANTYSGGTTVSEGALVVSNGAALGSGALRLDGGELRSTASFTLPNTLALSGNNLIAAAHGTTLTTGAFATTAVNSHLQFGAPGFDGTIVWKGSVEPNGGEPSASVDVVAGTLKMGAGGAAGSLLTTVSVQQGATLELAAADYFFTLGGGTGRVLSTAGGREVILYHSNFAGELAGDMRIKIELGKTTLSGVSTYDGGTSITAGSELELRGDGALRGAIVNDGILTLNSPNLVDFGNPVSGLGALVKLGRGRLHLTADNNFSGGIQLLGGTLTVARASELGSGQITLGEAELRGLTDLRLQQALHTLGRGTVAAAHGTTLTWDPAHASSTPLGGLIFGTASADGAVVFDFSAGANYPFIKVVAGSLRNGSLDAHPLAGGAPLLWQVDALEVAAGASLDLDGVASKVQRLDGTGRILSSRGAPLLQIARGEFNGSIEGDIGVEIDTAVILGGTNTYSGGTHVLANADLALSAGAAIVGDMRVEGALLQGADTSANYHDLSVSGPSAQGGGQYVQAGGATTVDGRFSLGVNGPGSYTLQGGSLALRASNIVSGAAAAARFNWRHGALRFLDDYTLGAGAPLLAQALTLDTTKHLQARNLAFAADATVQLQASTLVADQMLSNAGSISGTGTLAAATLSNSGRLAFEVGDSAIEATVINDASGQVDLAAGATLTLLGDFTNQGSLQVAKGATANFKARVSGAGAFTGEGKSVFESEVHVGMSPARVVMSGTQIFASGAVLDMDLAGSAGAGDCARCYAQLVFEGAVEFHGTTLQLNLVDAYIPLAGDAFTLLVFKGTHGGAFDQLILPKLGRGLLWDTRQLESLGRLQVAAVPLPGAGWMLMPGLTLLASRGRRRVPQRARSKRAGK